MLFFQHFDYTIDTTNQFWNCLFFVPMQATEKMIIWDSCQQKRCHHSTIRRNISLIVILTVAQYPGSTELTITFGFSRAVTFVMAMTPTFATPYLVLGHPFAACDPSCASTTNSFIYPSSGCICRSSALRLSDGKMESLPAELAILMIRGEEDFSNSGTMARVKASVPRKFVRTVLSAYFPKYVWGTLPYNVGSLKQTAALLMSTSHDPYLPWISFAAA